MYEKETIFTIIRNWAVGFFVLPARCKKPRKNKTQFKGKPLSKDVQIGFLECKFGEEFLVEYQGRVERDYRNNKNLRILTESNGLVVGSNPFAVVLADQILREEKLRVATQADLEKALRLQTLDLSGTYEDTGLVLRSEAYPNSYLAGDLTKQLRARDPKVQYPVLLNPRDLSLRLDAASPYDLAFKLREDASPVYALVLNSPNGSKFSSLNIDESTGLPKQVGEGDRVLYTRDSGLSRLYLNWFLVLDSYGVDLADLGGGGRVVVISGEATQKNHKWFLE